MKGRFDRILCLDLEATCWENSWVGRPASEVIEVGAVLVNTGVRDVVDEFQTFVRPEHLPLSRFCIDLTTITDQDLAGAPGFRAAMRKLEGFSRKHDVGAWCSWGDYDREQIARECAAKGVSYRMPRTHMNLKAYLSALIGHKRGHGMQRALEQLKLGFQGTPHRGIDDARNLGRLLLEVQRRTNL